MRTLSALIFGALFVVSAVGCQKAGAEDDAKRHQELMDRIAVLEKKIDTMGQGRAGGPGGVQPQQRKRPEPNVVYFAPVEADDHIVGPADAKVTIVEAFEYACPHCRTAGQVLTDVAKKYPKDVRIVGKQFLIHPQIASLPAYAACAANKQGRYHEFSEELWKRAWPVAEGAPGPRLDREQLTQSSLEKTAADVKLDLAKFKADMAGDVCKKEVAQDQAQMQAIGVTGTPSVFVNGKIYMGPRSVEGFSAVIDEEIKKADEAAKGGTKPSDYYTTLMKSAKKSI